MPAYSGRSPERTHLRAQHRAIAVLLGLVAVLTLAACAAAPPAPTSVPATWAAIVVVTETPTPAATAAPVATATARAVAVAPSPSPSPAATTTPIPAPSATATATRAPATPSPSATPRANIVVTSPTAGQRVQSPVRVAGVARVFEATVAYEIVGGGRSLASGFTTATAGAPEWGTFQVAVAAGPVETATAATVRVFTHSMRDGSVQDLVEIPITLEPGGAQPPTPASAASPTQVGTRQVTIYLVRRSNSGVAYVPVQRTIKSTPAIGTAALNALLAGPMIEERMQSLDSPIPEGTTLRSLRIVDGVAYADFSSMLLEYDGDQARARSIARVIALTLEQFSTVQRVVISVEGRTDGVPQP